MSRFFIYSILTLSAIGTIFLHEHLSTFITTTNMQEDAASYAESLNKEVPTAAFTQNGCLLFPNRLPWHDFRSACFAHDQAYWLGGSKEERLASDIAFKEAISHTGPIGPVFGYIVYGTTRLFGDTAVTKIFNSNWGYGWNE